MNSGSLIIYLIGILYSAFSNFPIEILFSTFAIGLFVSYAQEINIPFSIQFYFALFFLQIVTALFFLDITEEVLIIDKFNFLAIKELELITIFHLLLGIVAFFFVFRNNVIIGHDLLYYSISKIKFNNLLVFYLLMSFFFPLFSLISGNNASLQQFFMALASLKDLALILLIFHFIVLKTNRLLIFGILLFEFLLGFISYFSSFKTVLIYIIIVSLTTSNRISFKRLRVILPIVIFTIYTMAFWSYVKGDYREFLRDGEVGQSINIENSIATKYMLEQFIHFGVEEFNVGVQNFFGRTQYLKEYHTVVQNVPSIQPHQNGKLTMESIEFITTPRFLNPDKKILDPSQKTAKYTGREVATADMGTSISLGFFADLYIDFGFVGMILPIIVIFVLLGWFCKRILINKKYSPIFNISMLVAIVTHIGTFESDLTFFLGILRNYVVVYFFCDLFLFKFLNKYLTGQIDDTRNREKILHLNLASTKK